MNSVDIPRRLHKNVSKHRSFYPITSCSWWNFYTYTTRIITYVSCFMLWVKHLSYERLKESRKCSRTRLTRCNVLSLRWSRGKRRTIAKHCVRRHRGHVLPSSSKDFFLFCEYRIFGRYRKHWSANTYSLCDEVKARSNIHSNQSVYDGTTKLQCINKYPIKIYLFYKSYNSMYTI